MSDWTDMDWQDRADTGRDLGGRHLGDRPRRAALHIFHGSDRACAMCGRERSAHPMSAVRCGEMGCRRERGHDGAHIGSFAQDDREAMQ